MRLLSTCIAVSHILGVMNQGWVYMTLKFELSFDFYRTMHYSAKRSLALACRLSVCPSVTLVDHDHIG